MGCGPGASAEVVGVKVGGSVVGVIVEVGTGVLVGVGVSVGGSVGVGVRVSVGVGVSVMGGSVGAEARVLVGVGVSAAWCVGGEGATVATTMLVAGAGILVRVGHGVRVANSTTCVGVPVRQAGVASTSISTESSSQESDLVRFLNIVAHLLSHNAAAFAKAVFGNITARSDRFVALLVTNAVLPVARQRLSGQYTDCRKGERYHHMKRWLNGPRQGSRPHWWPSLHDVLR